MQVLVMVVSRRTALIGCLVQSKEVRGVRETHPLPRVREGLHPGLHSVHWEHGQVLCHASNSASDHMLQRYKAFR